MNRNKRLLFLWFPRGSEIKLPFAQRTSEGAGIVAQYVRLLLVMLASHIDTGLSTSCSICNPPSLLVA